MWHAFGTRSSSADPYNLFVSEEAFARQIGQLRAGGWDTVDLDGFLEVAAGRRAARRSVLITIDDGYRSTMEIAAPVLARHGMPALLFVPPARLGGSSSWMTDMADEPLLDHDELRSLAQYGIELGVHGMDHELMAGMDAEALRRNVVDARDLLADLVGSTPRSFAYPSGSHDRAARDAVESAGYEVAFSVHDAAGRFAVPRTDVNATDTDRTFRWKLSGAWPAAYAVGRRLPAVRRALHRMVGSARRSA